MGDAKVLTIVGWLWRDPKCRTQYSPEHANIWARMLHRNLTIPHRFVVFTDDMSDDFDPLIEKYPLWSDYHLLDNPGWQGDLPQCYVRLKAFSRDMEMVRILGLRFVSIDFDCVVLGNMDRILTRKEPFLIWKRPKFEKGAPYNDPYNGSMWMMDTGCRPKVWEEFSQKALDNMPQEIQFQMTDQGWMLYKLGPREACWTQDDGVYMWSWLCRRNIYPPENCKIIFFNGSVKPWGLLQWLTEAYQ